MDSHSGVMVGDRKLSLSNLDKVFYPETGFTKAQVIEYYHQIAEFLLPHLKGRPVTLKRYPDGIEGGFFYEKRCPKHRPAWVSTVAVEKGEGEEPPIDYCVLGTLPSLIWAVNLASLELHTFLHVRRSLNHPQYVVFDLDPGEGVGMRECAEVALEMRRRLAKRKLRSFAKTSGSKGLQLYVPLNSGTSYSITRDFAHRMALEMERSFPEGVVSKMTRELRKKKVFIDWSQNHSKKTTVSLYSLRAVARPSVSTPVDWAEIEAAARGSAPLVFSPDEVLRRVKKDGDLFAPLLKLRQTLKA